jgi:hypothetical protein
MATPTNQFRLNLRPSTAYNFTVNWGDGTQETFNQITSATNETAGITHTYPTSGIYNVSITKNSVDGFPSLNGGNVYYTLSGDQTKLIDIVSWGSIPLTSLNAAFEGSVNLSSVAPYNSFDRVTNFYSAWNNCNKLKTFPVINLGNATVLDRTWAHCTSLTSFPLIDTKKIITFNRPWQLCRNIINFPLIDTSNATQLTNTWENCEKMTSFPAISTNKVVAFNNTWSACYALTSFPLINTSNATSLAGAWYQCNTLSNFPLIDTSSVTNFQGTWYGCNTLSNFPLIDTSSVTNFQGTWSFCSKLTSFPNINTSKATTFTEAWYGCSSLSSFPSLSTSNVTNLSYTWSGCAKLTAFPLIDTSKVSVYTRTWENCYSLSEFPLIDTSNSFAFVDTWKNCYSLSARDFPTLNMSKLWASNGSAGGCFQGVKLKTNSYSLLLSSLRLNNNNIGITFHGGNSNYNSYGKEARDILTSSGTMPMNTSMPYFCRLKDGRFFFCGSPYTTNFSYSTDTFLGTLSGNYISWVKSTSLPIGLITNRPTGGPRFFEIGQLTDNRIAMYDGSTLMLGTLSSNNSISWISDTSFNYASAYDSVFLPSYTICLMKDLDTFFINGGTQGNGGGILKTFIGKINGTTITWLSATNPPGTSVGPFGMRSHFSVASGNKIIIGGGDTYGSSGSSTSRVDIGTVNINTGNISWVNSTSMPVGGRVLPTFSDVNLIIPNNSIGSVNFTNNTITWNTLSSINTNTASSGLRYSVMASTSTSVSSIYCGSGATSAAHLFEFDITNKTQKTSVLGGSEWTIIDGGFINPLELNDFSGNITQEDGSAILLE